MRVRLSILSLALPFALAAVSAQATPVSYNLNGTLANGATLTGVVVFDSAKTSDSTATFSVQNKGSVQAFSDRFQNSYEDIEETGQQSDYYYFGNSTSNILSFYILGGTPDDLTQGTFCTTLSKCTYEGGFARSALQYNYSQSNFTSGSLTAVDGTTPSVAATPEPSSLVLLGTGVLGVFGAARRRFLA